MWMLLYLSYTPIKNPCQPWVRMNGIASASSSASTSTRSIWYISIYSSGAYIWQGYELLYKGWCLWDLIIYISTEYWGRFPNLHILPPKGFTLDLGWVRMNGPTSASARSSDNIEGSQIWYGCKHLYSGWWHVCLLVDGGGLFLGMVCSCHGWLSSWFP